ncbi:hypothetical protein Pmar_PMAR003166, partial [Perkinsus marinus ATCC 50983]
ILSQIEINQKPRTVTV